MKKKQKRFFKLIKKESDSKDGKIIKSKQDRKHMGNILYNNSLYYNLRSKAAMYKPF